MANENLKGKKVAILVTDGFEQVELLKPREALDKAGAETGRRRNDGDAAQHATACALEVGQGSPGRSDA